MHFSRGWRQGIDGCVVWAGFDKPQKIYRGAFGSEIALPVWVDIMNASIPGHAPREIAKPPGVQTVEICARSGLLATDKCYDTVKNDAGETVQRRTTYRELATKAQMPTEPCDVHGDASGRIVRDLPEAEWPRAALAVDTAQLSPIIAKGPTLIADDDPYNAVRSTAKPKTEVPCAEKPETIATGTEPPAPCPKWITRSDETSFESPAGHACRQASSGTNAGGNSTRTAGCDRWIKFRPLTS